MRVSVDSRCAGSLCHRKQFLCFLRLAPSGSGGKLVQNHAGGSVLRASLSTQAAYMARTGVCSVEGSSTVFSLQIWHLPRSIESHSLRLKPYGATSPSVRDRPGPAAGKLDVQP